MVVDYRQKILAVFVCGRLVFSDTVPENTGKFGIYAALGVGNFSRADCLIFRRLCVLPVFILREYSVFGGFRDLRVGFRRGLFALCGFDLIIGGAGIADSSGDFGSCVCRRGFW